MNGCERWDPAAAASSSSAIHKKKRAGRVQLLVFAATDGSLSLSPLSSKISIAYLCIERVAGRKKGGRRGGGTAYFRVPFSHDDPTSLDDVYEHLGTIYQDATPPSSIGCRTGCASGEKQKKKGWADVTTIYIGCDNITHLDQHFASVFSGSGSTSNFKILECWYRNWIWYLYKQSLLIKNE